MNATIGVLSWERENVSLWWSSVVTVVTELDDDDDDVMIYV